MFSITMALIFHATACGIPQHLQRGRVRPATKHALELSSYVQTNLIFEVQELFFSLLRENQHTRSAGESILIELLREQNILDNKRPAIYQICFNKCPSGPLPFWMKILLIRINLLPCIIPCTVALVWILCNKTISSHKCLFCGCEELESSRVS